MGYASYPLPDGRQAGYAVKADCDHSDCHEQITRGLDCLCGDVPGGHEPGVAGCGNYHCRHHQDPAAHDCQHPPCAQWDPEETMTCELLRDHDGAHYSATEDEHFTTTFREAQLS